MRFSARTIIVCVAMLIALFAGASYAAHMYYIGVLSSFSNNEMIVDGKAYELAPKARVILRVIGSNGAIHERKGQLSDITVGNKVTIKVSNGQITDIEKVVSR